ncbi:MAG: triose-phosphate isomerase [candidate division WOR-3 bacterium]
MSKVKAIIAGNWKMHKTPAESRELSQQILLKTRDIRDRTIIICPPFTSLYDVNRIVAGSHIKLGAQNMSFEKSGAYTGEVSGVFLKELGCEYVIIGHSERRSLFYEDDSLINKKLKLALEIGLIPIFCIGETLKDRETGKTFDVVRRQIREGLNGLTWNENNVIIAYEPVWAIGTGINATPGQAAEVHHFIRETFRTEFGVEPDRMAILYGGSVKPNNIDELMAEDEINGVLVGGASLDAQDFLRIVKFTKLR